MVSGNMGQNCEIIVGFSQVFHGISCLRGNRQESLARELLFT